MRPTSVAAVICQALSPGLSQVGYGSNSILLSGEGVGPRPPRSAAGPCGQGPFKRAAARRGDLYPRVQQMAGSPGHRDNGASRVVQMDNAVAGERSGTIGWVKLLRPFRGVLLLALAAAIAGHHHHHHLQSVGMVTLA